MSRLLLSTLATLALSPALAFTGDKVDGIGIEPARTFPVDVATQGALHASSPWQQFIAGEGQGWQARFDQHTGTPHRMWGTGIAIDTTSADSVVADLAALFDRNPGLHGKADLRLKSANYVERVDTWYVDFDVLIDGLPVWRGGATARVKHGNLIAAGFDTYPNTLATGEQRLDANEAQLIAAKRGPAPHAMHSPESERLMWLPIESEAGVHNRLVWEVRSETFKPVGQWVSFVDAETGELLNVHNEVRFATVTAEHDTRTVNGDTSVSPLPFLRIEAGGTHGFADAFGGFTPGDSAIGELNGEWFDVSNGIADDARFQLDGDRLITSADAHLAEIDTYIFLHQIRDWALEVAPEVRLSAERAFKANVNQDDVCNAFYDGRSVNFFQAGQGCNNTGRIADVVYHEWGHGFHDYSIQAGVFDGSISEGAADVVSFLQTGDATVAPYFMTNGRGIREVARNRVYPDDVVGEVHEDGLIFAGAVWDLWDMAKTELGDEAGTALTTDIFTGLLKGGPTLETAYDEAIIADDDDGDLSNGTPNQCLIIDAFLLHGLGPNGGALVVPSHDPYEGLVADTPNSIEVELVNLAPTCLSGAPRTGALHYQVDGSGWNSLDMQVTGANVSADLPALPAGSFVEYWLEVDTDDAGRTSLPSGGVINPFVAYVGDVLPVYCEDFEADDGGFGHLLVSGEDVEGADDWQWGTPAGLSGDPSMAYSGEKVWGNDLGGGEYNGAYQPDRVNRLFSPQLDTRHYVGTHLEYKRWLSVEDGTFDQARIYADENPVWSNWSSEGGSDNHQDGQWAPHAVDLQGAGDDGVLSLVWEIQSDSGLEMGGWTLDDVCLFAPDTPDNRLGIADFTAEESSTGRSVVLAWTNPMHDPVQELVIVRKNAAYPEGPDDGKVVFRTDDIEIGAPMRIEDKFRGSAHYAIYASDGTNWLSWTRPGLNADINGAEEAGGCGCSSAPGAAGWMALGLVGLVVRRRRS
ncbi:MAG: hypothetical protein KC912_03050 [Proteobacteria bacterium]|nr:hypothetical protein [Pseudomonadota bacterium]